MRKLGICPNAYYNFLKDKKSAYRAKKQRVLRELATIYHEHNGIDGYRSMQVFLARKQIHLSAHTVHHYMNKELNLHAIVRRKKPNYQKGTAHKVFDNLLNQDFQAEQSNQKWATDFTYIFLKDGSVRYNCSVIDLHDRSVVSSITDRNITSNLAIRTVKKALEAQATVSRNLILHSDQGSQFTSKEFTEFCESVGITQSMSKAGYPYDNAPMERYFNTLKNELMILSILVDTFSTRAFNTQAICFKEE